MRSLVMAAGEAVGSYFRYFVRQGTLTWYDRISWCGMSRQEILCA